MHASHAGLLLGKEGGEKEGRRNQAGLRGLMNGKEKKRLEQGSSGGRRRAERKATSDIKGRINVE